MYVPLCFTTLFWMSLISLSYFNSGLGAGLSTRALMQHNINLTVVEIDPVVYEYARQYFGVPEPAGGVYLEDARAFLRRKSSVVSISTAVPRSLTFTHFSTRLQRYDYVIHDVVRRLSSKKVFQS